MPSGPLSDWAGICGFASHYLLLATIHNEKMMAAAISIAHAACEQPHRMRAIPATVAGAMAAAATPARCRRVTLYRHLAHVAERQVHQASEQSPHGAP